MAGGTFLQNHEAAVAGQEIPWNQRQCCESAGLGCPDRLSLARYCALSIKARLGNTRSDGGCHGGPVLKSRSGKPLGAGSTRKMRPYWAWSAITMADLTGR